MTLRLALAVALAGALVAVSAPAVDDATAERGVVRAEAAAERIADAAGRLRRDSDPVRNASVAARRTLRVDLPDGPVGLLVGRPAVNATPGTEAPRPPPGDAIRLTRSGVPGRVVERVPLPFRTRGGPGAGALHLDGEATLTLRLVTREGRPAILLTRGFKYGNGTTPAHA